MTRRSADSVFEYAAKYLNDNGWYQDGDDPGIWIDSSKAQHPYKTTLGVALEVQMIRDNFHPWIVR